MSLNARCPNRPRMSIPRIPRRQGQPFSVELGLSDAGGVRRRLILSASFSELKVTPLHCQVRCGPRPRLAGPGRRRYTPCPIPLHGAVTRLAVTRPSACCAGAHRLAPTRCLAQPGAAAGGPGGRALPHGRARLPEQRAGRRGRRRRRRRRGRVPQPGLAHAERCLPAAARVHAARGPAAAARGIGPLGPSGRDGEAVAWRWGCQLHRPTRSVAGG